MRYLKGSIELVNIDLKLLEVVANANKITQPQLFEISILKDIERQRKRTVEPRQVRRHPLKCHSFDDT